MVSRAELGFEKVVREIRRYIPAEDFQQKDKIIKATTEYLASGQQ
jgi:hypothetical protein